MRFIKHRRSEDNFPHISAKLENPFFVVLLQFENRQ